MAKGGEAAEPLIEALAATLDENLAQLREWQRAIRDPKEQIRVEQALRADSQRQAKLLAGALQGGIAQPPVTGADGDGRR